MCNVLSTKQPLTCLEYVTALCVNHNYIHSHEHMLTDENESTTYIPLTSLYFITIYKWKKLSDFLFKFFFLNHWTIASYICYLAEPKYQLICKSHNHVSLTQNVQLSLHINAFKFVVCYVEIQKLIRYSYCIYPLAHLCSRGNIQEWPKSCSLL